jgi:hypothetical protein
MQQLAHLTNKTYYKVKSPKEVAIERMQRN